MRNPCCKHQHLPRLQQYPLPIAPLSPRPARCCARQRPTLPQHQSLTGHFRSGLSSPPTTEASPGAPIPNTAMAKQDRRLRGRSRGRP